MNLPKIFQFKGLYQNGSKANTPLGYFRRFTNSYKDKGGKIIPYGMGEEDTPNIPTYQGAPTEDYWLSPLLSAVFKGGIFQLIRGEIGGDQIGGFKYTSDNIYSDREVAQVYSPDRLMDLTESMEYQPGGNFTTATVNNKLYFCEYVNRSEFTYSNEAISQDITAFSLMKFDGLQVSRAGLPTPWLIANPDAAGTRRMRAVYMSVGFDAEPVFSNYLETKVAVNGSNEVATLYPGAYTTAGLVTLRTDPVGNSANYFPLVRQPEDSLLDGPTSNYYNKKWIKHSANFAFTPGVGLTVGSTNSAPNLKVGDWLMIVPGYFLIARIKYDGYYLKIKEISGSNYTFNSKIKGYNGITNSWDDIDLENGPPAGIASNAALCTELNTRGLSNIHMVLSFSQDATGSLPYKVAHILPVYWDSAETFTNATTTTDLMNLYRPMFGVITQTFTDWYDITRVKTTFPPVIGITQYSGLLVGFDANFLYFNDTTFGGSTDMVSGVSNLAPYGSEYGDIVAICGSENFLLISRERKNYILTGELTTGNVAITECDQAVGGASNARAVTNAFSDKVLLMNPTGIYAAAASGQLTEISKDIRDLFIANPLSANRPQDGNLFDINVFRSRAEKFASIYDGSIFKFALDERRGFIFILTGLCQPVTHELVQSNILVYDTNDGSWYEFHGNESTSIEALSGWLYNLGETMYKENGVVQEADAGQVLALSWVTMGEPSLEKQFNQVKFYGTLEKDTGITDQALSLLIKQQNNWGSALHTDVVYVPETEDSQYAHKQRLTASKAQSTSIIFETTGGNALTLEGIELELEVIQQGVKK